MKKLFTLIIVALFAASNTVLAEDVSPEQALQLARQFAANPSTRQLSRRQATDKPATPTMAHAMRSKVSAKDNVYVVNLGDDLGFMIISGETGADDMLLGYCDHGSFSYDDAPIQLKDLLNSYSEQVDMLRQNPVSASRAQTRASADIGTVIVGPLLTTTWNQWSPYNNQCPESPDGYSFIYGGRCPTGCYPTAIAQVMNYWKWPKMSQGKLQNHIDGMFDGEDFSGHVYDWDNMLDNYGYDYSTYTLANFTAYDDVQANAVAKLMADIGTAFHTSYGTAEGSPTGFRYSPLIHNFGYSPDIQEHSGATAQELISVMKNDLDQFRPVLYCGGNMTKPTDCHALVCDGYTSNNYFHFNYGWGGASDGWYKNALCDWYSQNSIIFTGVCPSSAGREVIGDMEYSFLTSGEAHIVNYTQKRVTDAVVEIPDEVTDSEGNVHKVTRIWQHAFYGKGHFNKITLGNNVKSIDPFSFIQSSIDTLIIGDKVEEIPDGAFQLTRLTSLTIGKSIKRIGKQAFMLCFINNVVCKSPAFEVDDEAFLRSGGGKIGDGEWLRHITKIGYRAFAGYSFDTTPMFDNLEEIGEIAFYGSRFPQVLDNNNTYWRQFYVPAKLKKIDPQAFIGTDIQHFTVDPANPYFSAGEQGLQRGILYNKNATSLVYATNAAYYLGQHDFAALPETLIKMEPGCICSGEKNNRISVLIPNTVVEMEGAFKYSENISHIYCCSEIPPVVSDSTFNETLWNWRKYEKTAHLYVPEGSEELYRKAPGWRQFSTILPLEKGSIMQYENYKDYYLTPPQRQYDMVVHYTDEEGHKSVSVPVNEVGNVKMDDSGSKVVVSRPGQEDLTIDVAHMDSITWNTGFVYDDGEVFELNDSTLTAKAQNCTVTLGSTVIDRPVQLTIRNAVLTPKMAENMVRGKAVDISLSTGEHELTGTAKITIPIEKHEDETLEAFYFNRETGEWEPTYFRYDEDQGAAVILTSHFTEYGVCCLREEHTPRVKIKKYDLGLWSWDFNKTLAKLYGIVSGDKKIDDASVQAWRDDYGFWQSVGIDGGWNALQALGFQPEDVGHACDMVGYIGTMLTVLDVAKSDLQGDDISVASNTLKAINGFVTGQLASAIGTTIMQTSMVGVAVIGILLEKFGTMVQQRKKELIRAAYRHYYSMEGVNTVWNVTKYKDGDLSQDWWGTQAKYPNHQYRSKRDWYMYLKKPLEEGKITPENFKLLIEQAVRLYCDRFWDDSYLARSACYQKAKSWGLTSQLDAEDNISLQQEISNEYFAELMDGDIMEVFQKLRLYCEEAAGKRLWQYERNLQALMNSTFTVNIFDSTRKRGEKSKYAGWKFRIAEIPDSISDKTGWECTIGDDGTAKLEITKYALVKYQIHLKYILIDDRDISQKVFEYKIPVGSGKFNVKVDIATGGTAVEAPELKELELTYEPPTVPADMSWTGTYHDNGIEYYQDGQYTEGIMIYLNGWLNKKARFQMEIEKFFKQNDFIVVDEFGNIQIGDNIVGKFEGDEGKGSFTINTSHKFVEKTIDEYVQAFNKWSNDLWITWLDGTINHKIDCQFTLTRIPDSEEYAVSYTGQGTYSFKANVVDLVEGVNFDDLGHAQHVVKEQIHTREVSQEGSVKLQYTTKLR